MTEESTRRRVPVEDPGETMVVKRKEACVSVLDIANAPLQTNQLQLSDWSNVISNVHYFRLPQQVLTIELIV